MASLTLQARHIFTHHIAGKIAISLMITLSGGEAQRIRLATQIGSNLSGVLYILDEPSIGLHQRDNDRLIASLRAMCERIR